MIKRIFLDLDETLIYTAIDEHPGQECFVHDDGDGLGPNYFTIVNPHAKDIIEFSMNLVGKENVYILTAAGNNYANRVNDKAKFGILRDNIFSHNDIQRMTFHGAYGGYFTHPLESIADKNNVLVDNLPPRGNEQKCGFIGIMASSDRYIQVRDFYGVLFSTYSYKDIVCEKLKELHERD